MEHITNLKIILSRRRNEARIQRKIKTTKKSSSQVDPEVQITQMTRPYINKGISVISSAHHTLSDPQRKAAGKESLKHIIGGGYRGFMGPKGSLAGTPQPSKPTKHIPKNRKHKRRKSRRRR